MSDDKQIINRMVEAAGHATQSLGVGRVLGQIFAYLYFNPEPQSLNNLTAGLGISKGSASMGVRQLEQWGALEKVWIKGDRKDYYKACDDFGRIIRNAIVDLAGKRISDYSHLLDEIEDEVASEPENKFIATRVAQMRSFQKKTQGLWDGVLLKMLLK